MEELKPKISSEVTLTVVDDSTLDVLHLNKIKKEFTLSEPSSHGGFVDHAVEIVERDFIETVGKKRISIEYGHIPCPIIRWSGCSTRHVARGIRSYTVWFKCARGFCSCPS